MIEKSKRHTTEKRHVLVLCIRIEIQGHWLEDRHTDQIENMSLTQAVIRYVRVLRWLQHCAQPQCPRDAGPTRPEPLK